MTDSVDLAMGPYTVRYIVNNEKIIVVVILSKPFLQTKKLHKKYVHIIDMNKKYIQGNPRAFHGAPIDLQGTAFQKKVWAATRKIPYGQTRTYSQIANQIGHPKAVRAVGTALGKNPVCVIVPCHRVVPASGGIGNYAYGTNVKRWLLDHEAGCA